MENVPFTETGAEMHDMAGSPYVRTELNRRWVQYAFYDDANRVARRVALPRIPTISDEVIAASDQQELSELR